MGDSSRRDRGPGGVTIAGVLDPGRGTGAAGGIEPTLRLGPLTVSPSDGVAVHDDGRIACCLLGSLLDGGSASDLAAAYLRERETALQPLRGSFLAVLWDRERREGILAQDQLASRAWYLHSSAGTLTFASEIPPLLEALPRRPAPDPTGVVHWLTSRSAPEGITMFSDVRRLQIGHGVAISERGWRTLRVWQPRYERPMDVSREEAAGIVRDAVRRAVASRLAPDSRTAILLSGGFDSGTLAGTAAPILSERGDVLPAYSSVFPGEPHDESPSVEVLTSELGLPSTRLRIHPQGTISRALRYQLRWEMPQPAPGSITDQPLIQRAVADGATVVFDGQGGDEVFTHSPFLLADRFRQLRWLAAYRLMSRYPGVREGLDARTARKLLARWGYPGVLPYRIHRLYAERRHGSNGRSQEAEWLSADAMRHYRPVDFWAWKRTSGPRWWAHLLALTTAGRDEAGNQDFLRRRAHLDGLESRSPLMADVDLVELVLRLPPELAFDPWVDRALARESMTGIVPEPVRRPAPRKSNYAGFIHRALTGPDLDAFRRLLLRPDAEVRAWVRPEALHRHFERAPGLQDRGWQLWGHRTWALATLELWLQAQQGADRLEQLGGELRLPEPAADVLMEWRR